MTECIVCYDSFAQGLSNICPSCQQAPVCDSCKIQWKQRCASLSQDFTCPKCRAIIEQSTMRPNRLVRNVTLPMMFLSWFVDIPRVSQSRVMRTVSAASNSLLSSIVPVMILGSLAILFLSLFTFVSRRHSLSSTFWSVLVIGTISMYWYCVVLPLWIR